MLSLVAWIRGRRRAHRILALFGIMGNLLLLTLGAVRVGIQEAGL